eukprot:2143760-Prymnesium_polylepis.2
MHGAEHDGGDNRSKRKPAARSSSGGGGQRGGGKRGPAVGQSADIDSDDDCDNNDADDSHALRPSSAQMKEAFAAIADVVDKIRFATAG